MLLAIKMARDYVHIAKILYTIFGQCESSLVLDGSLNRVTHHYETRVPGL